MKKTEKKPIIIGIIGIIIILIGSTYAYYKWTSTNNMDFSVTINGSTVTFNGNSALVGTNLIPVATKTEGLRKDIFVKASREGSTMSLNLELTTLPTGLIDSTFKYELVKVSGGTTTTKKSGNFSTYTSGNTITLLTDEPVSTTEEKYSLYLWIDGTAGVNDPKMQEQEFSFNLTATGKGAILG